MLPLESPGIFAWLASACLSFLSDEDVDLVAENRFITC